MSDSDFWPSVQPLDDLGADPSAGADKDFGLQVQLGSSYIPPADTAEKLKSIFQTSSTGAAAESSSPSKPSKELVSKANKLKKEIRDAFPLEDRL